MLQDDLSRAQRIAYEPNGLLCSSITHETESREYGALTFVMNNKSILFQCQQKLVSLLLYAEEEKPVLLVRNLLHHLAPGKQLGNLLKRAYEIQINEGIDDKEELKRRVL